MTLGHIAEGLRRAFSLSRSFLLHCLHKLLGIRALSWAVSFAFSASFNRFIYNRLVSSEAFFVPTALFILYTLVQNMDVLLILSVEQDSSGLLLWPLATAFRDPSCKFLRRGAKADTPCTTLDSH